MNTEREIFDRGAPPIAQSGWTKPQGLARPYSALEGDIEGDVAIIGAGLAGASLALHLAEAGLKPIVLEARQPGWGASGRNAGHVLPIVRSMKVFESFPDSGRAFLESFRAHHTIPYDLAAQYGINGMSSKGAYQAFLAQSANLENLGLQKLIRMDATEMRAALGTSKYTFGVAYENGGRINPYLFTNGMITAALQHGASVHGDSEALTLQKAGSRWRVRTAHGTVTANRVVFCTNAYPTKVAPEFTRAFYPLTAYALTTKPLPVSLRDKILPAKATFAQVPIDLNPLVRDRHDRLILSSIPRPGGAHDAQRHFLDNLRWIESLWPAARGAGIELESYWTGQVALRDQDFPGVFELQPGLYGLMYFNAWGNVMAPLIGKLMAEGLAKDRMDALPFPIGKPEPVSFAGKQDLLIRRLLIPIARAAQRWGFL
jgi:glycine/D-amino acid oxidase-like deaminating enzyme